MPGRLTAGAPSNGSCGGDRFEEELVVPCPFFPLREVRRVLEPHQFLPRRDEAREVPFGQLDGVGDQLTDGHRHSWLDGRSGLARTALVPFDDDEVILEESVEPG